MNVATSLSKVKSERRLSSTGPNLSTVTSLKEDEESEEATGQGHERPNLTTLSEESLLAAATSLEDLLPTTASSPKSGVNAVAINLSKEDSLGKMEEENIGGNYPCSR